MNFFSPWPQRDQNFFLSPHELLIRFPCWRKIFHRSALQNILKNQITLNFEVGKKKKRNANELSTLSRAFFNKHSNNLNLYLKKKVLWKWNTDPFKSRITFRFVIPSFYNNSKSKKWTIEYFVGSFNTIYPRQDYLSRKILIGQSFIFHL